MKKAILSTSLACFLVAGFAATANAHSGGTDANGCHAGSQPYHCHNGGTTPSPTPAPAPAPEPAPAPTTYPTAGARDIEDTCSSHQTDRFSDTGGSPHEYAINCVAGWEITTGKTESTYDPAGPLTRGQTATFLVRTLEAADVAVPAASDTCSETDVHAPNMERLIAAGVVPAPSDRRCLTSHAITREVMASWTRGALAFGGVTTADATDWYSDDDASRYETHINQITSLGIVTGKGGGLFGPYETLTRGQMATFLARTLDALRA